MSQISTFGCRINSYESEIIREIVKNYSDYIVVNTCSVTAEAHRQCLQAIRKARRENPKAKIIVTGCAATIAPEDFAGIADVVIKNDDKLNPSCYTDTDECKPAIITGFEGRNRAFIQVQQGCDFKCTYCIVPKARGTSFSIPYDQIKFQIEKFLENDVKEIVITGINISDYNGGIPNLTKKILNDFNDIRLRFGSLDPAMIDAEMLEVFGDDRLMPHLHLSVQSGDDLILKRMGRRHDRKTVIEISEKLHAIRSDMMLGADFITGFPTETDEQFKNTCDLVKQANLSMLHVFPYSERPSTPAAQMPQIDVKVRKDRAAILRDIGKDLLIEKLKTRVGKTINVLFETDDKGHSNEFITVCANGKQGRIMPVTINYVVNDQLLGDIE